MKDYIYCDTCKEETLHELVRAEKHLYRCSECGTFNTSLPRVEVEVRAIVSSGAESVRGLIRAYEGESLEKGDEYIVETENGHKVGEITSIELKDGRRVETATVGEIRTVWLRDVGEVEVRMSLHKRSVTSPYKMVVDGETEFEVGEILYVDGKKYRIHRIRLLSGEVVRKEGRKVRAKEVRRIYAKYEG